VSKACQNPICKNRVDPPLHDNGKRAWRRTPRRFCSEDCKMDHWAIRRVVKLLYPLGKDRAWLEIEIQETCPRILDAITSGGIPLTNEELANQIGIRREIVDRATERLRERRELRLTPEQPEAENGGTQHKGQPEIVHPDAT